MSRRAGSVLPPALTCCRTTCGKTVSASAASRAATRFCAREARDPVWYRGDVRAAEAFDSTVKVECVQQDRFRARVEAQLKIATWIPTFSNTRRGAYCGASAIDLERFMTVASAAA